VSKRSRRFITAVVVSAGPPLVALAVQHYMANPDALRLLSMRGSLAVKRVADAQVSVWQRVSAAAATSYHRARL
jgi:hypothetical protein